MFRYVKILLFVILSLGVSALWPLIDSDSRTTAVQECFSNVHISEYGGCTATQHEPADDLVPPDEAARIHRRYHERLAAFFSRLSSVSTDVEKAPCAVNEVVIYGTAYNSNCLSSCYEYLFRLSPF